MDDVCMDSRGNYLMIEEDEVGGHRYWSTEIGSGVMVWCTSLVSREMMLLALAAEVKRATKGDVDSPTYLMLMDLATHA